MLGRRTVVLLAVALLAALTHSIHSARAEDSSRARAAEVLRVLGEAVVGDAQPARTLGEPVTLARWEQGEWKYRITAGPRKGKTEREIVAPISATKRGETWERAIGQDYTLFLRVTADGSLVMPSEIVQTYDVLVVFEPPLSYLLANLGPDERRVFDGKMDVYASRGQGAKLYSGHIQATTVFDGVYRVTTPAGTFNAALIRTDYQIDILSLVSVKDTLYTFYAEGIGKVAEAEHRRISATLFSSDTKTGRVLVSFTLPSPPPRIEAP